MAGEPNLSPGDAGEWVAYLQEMLAHNGYPVPADGTYGDATVAAVDQFQQAHGISTGSVDATTWALLTGETPPAEAGTITFDPGAFPILFGMHGVQGEQYVAALGIPAPAEGDTARS